MEQSIPTPWDGVATQPDEDAPNTTQDNAPATMAGGFHGASPQPVVVDTTTKGPKIPMIIAAVLIAFGLLGFVIGGIAAASVEETLENLSTADYTTDIGPSGTLVHDDADGAGEAGWYLLIPGDPKADENNNGIIDACEGIHFSIQDADGDDASERVADISCEYERKGSGADVPYFDIENHIVVAVICNTLPDDTGEVRHRCEIGESLTVSNDGGVNMSVVDLDEMYIPYLEEIIGGGILSAGSFGAGCCSLCGGIVFLIVGLTRIGGGRQQPNVVYQIH